MKKKHIEVDENVHLELKKQALDKGMTLKRYMQYLAELHEAD